MFGLEHFLGAEGGLTALFIMGFLASTIVPIGSEWLLIAIVLQRGEWLVPVLVATTGNYLGACTTYLVGKYGGPFLIERVFRVDHAKVERAHRWYDRWGVLTLLFSWLPFVGDIFCFVAGIMNIPFLMYSLLVIAGKAVRYGVVSYLVVQGAALMG